MSLKRAGLVSAFALALTGALLWATRLPLANFAIKTLLERQGMGPVALEVTRLDPSGAHFTNISLHGAAIQASGLDVTYNLRDLGHGVVSAVVIDSLLARLDATGDSIKLAGGDAMTVPGGQTGGTAWRVESVKLNDAHVSLATPTGPLDASFSTTLAIGGSTFRTNGLTLDLSMPPVGGLHIVAPKLALTTPARGGIALAFDDLAVRSNEYPWGLSAMAGALTWSGGALAVTLTAGLLANAQSPAIVVPLAVSGSATLAGPLASFDLHGRDSSGVIDLTVAGTHNRTSGAGHATIASHPITFRTGGLQPKTLLPAVSGLPPLAGTVSVSGGVSWRDAGLTPALVVHVTDAALATQGIDLSKLRGDITLSGLAPLATASGQILRAVITSPGLPPTEAALAFQLLPTQTLHVQTLDLAVAGGQLSTSPFDLDPQNPSVDTLLSLHAVDMAKLLALIGVDGLDGTGHLGGAIQLRTTKGKLTVTSGHLAATEPGVLHLRADSLPKEITDAGESVALVVQALADFHYDTLSIDISTGANGAEKPDSGELALALRGNNPALLEGRAFNLNIKLATNFDRLIDIAFKSMQAAQALLQQAAGRTRK